MKKSNTLLISIPFMMVLFIFVLYEYGYQAVRDELSSIKDEEILKAKTLEKYIALISEKKELEDELAQLKEDKKSAESRLIEGQTPSLAAATLQDSVKGIIIGRGGAITSERVSKPEDLKKFKVISISKDAVTPDIRSLSDILYMIETQSPDMVVRELDVRVKDYRNPKELMIKLDVAALTKAR